MRRLGATRQSLHTRGLADQISVLMNQKWRVTLTLRRSSGSCQGDRHEAGHTQDLDIGRINCLNQ